MPTKTVEDPLAKAWAKLTSFNIPLTRAAYIPIYSDGKWRFLRNTQTIFEGAENCADPKKVEHLRRNVEDLYRVYPETLDALQKLGIRVRTQVNHPIRNQADVTAWATSMFNNAPQGQPEHVAATEALCYDDFHVEVPTGGKAPAYVIPAAPRGSGIAATLAFDVPGMKNQYGPRHDYTKAAFADQNGKATTAPAKVPEAAATATQGVRGRVRPVQPKLPSGGHRGRPRADGLVPGSVEAKAADAAKRKAAREKAKTITAPVENVVDDIPELLPHVAEVEKPKKLIRRHASVQGVA